MKDSQSKGPRKRGKTPSLSRGNARKSPGGVSQKRGKTPRTTNPGKGTSRPSSSRGASQKASGQKASRRGMRRLGGGRAPKRRKQNLWPRRIITGLGLILILALVVWAVLFIIGFMTTQPKVDESQSALAKTGEFIQSGTERIELRNSDEVTKDGVVTREEGVMIPGCIAKDLSFSATATQTRVGSGENLALTMVNIGRTACFTSLGRVDLAIRSGDQLIYDSARCASRDEEATPLLLSPGDPWSSSLAWDGRVYVQGCSTPEGGAPLANEGTYRAQLSFAGVPVTSELVFTVIEAAG